MIKSIKKISKKHYIQCGLAVLLTGLVLYFTSSLWLIRNILVTFNSQSEKDIEYRVFYTDASGQSFNGKQLLRKMVNSGNQRVEIIIPSERLLKFRMDEGIEPGKVVISGLQIKGSKIVNPDLSKVAKNQIDKYEIQGDVLTIYSDKKNPYFILNDTLDLLGEANVDWCRLIIISALAFLLMYKFVQYLSKFKIEKQHSRIDIVMLAVFFALLFVPMSHISDAEKSEQENRMLAKKPQLTIDGGGYNNYGVQFDTWYNDHFFGRDWMMWLYNKILRVNNVLDGKILYYDKNSRWFFHKASYNVYATTEQKENLLSALEDINEFARNNGIKFYLFIVPNKTDVYSAKHPLYTKNLNKLHGDYIHYLENKADFPVIYPLNELKQASKTDYVFFKRGHHWTEWGAYTGYLSIIKTLSKDFDNIKILSDSDYKIFYDDKMRDDWKRDFKNQNKVPFLNIKLNEEDLKNETYKYYNPIKKIEMKVIDESQHRIKEFKNTNVNNGLKVILTGTSNNENLLQFLPYSFKELRYLRFNTVKGVKAEDEYKLLKRYKQYIIDYKPDILIVSIVADNIPALINLSKEN